MVRRSPDNNIVLVIYNNRLNKIIQYYFYRLVYEYSLISKEKYLNLFQSFIYQDD